MAEGPLCIKSVLFTNLQLIISDMEAFRKKYSIDINHDSFDFPNNKAAFSILHFIIYKLFSKCVESQLSHCWPIVEKQQEGEFRKVCVHFLEQACSEFPEYSFPRTTLSTLMITYGSKFCMYLIRLTTSVMQKELKDMDPFISFPTMNISHMDAKTFKRAFQHRCKDYFSLYFQRISEEAAYIDELRKYWEKFRNNFDREFLRYNLECNQIRDKSSLLPDSSPSLKNIHKGIENIQQSIGTINEICGKVCDHKSRSLLNAAASDTSELKDLMPDTMSLIQCGIKLIDDAKALRNPSEVNAIEGSVVGHSDSLAVWAANISEANDSVRKIEKLQTLLSQHITPSLKRTLESLSL